MKPTLRIVSFLCLCIIASSSCKKEMQNTPPLVHTVAYEPDSSLYRKLLSYGFKAEDIVEVKDYYKVEGDILFRKFLTDTVLLEKYLGADSDKRQRDDSTFSLAQYYTGSPVSALKAESMRFFVDPSLRLTGWDDVAYLALTAWANVPGSRINFTQVEYSAAYANGNDIVMKADLEGIVSPLDIAQAEFPRFGNPGPTILINTEYNWLSASQKTYNIVHEIGHCMGFKHTNTGGTAPFILIPGTPTTDANSVMNAGSGSSNWNGFSTYDKIAIKSVYDYKGLSQWITYPEGKFGTDPLYPRSGYSVGTSSITIKWNKDLVNTSTVRLELYQNDVLKHVIAETAPNTGSFFAELLPYLDMAGNEWAFFVQIKIISNDNPSATDITSKFLIYEP